MQYRRLGKTNYHDSVLIFGAAALWNVKLDEARATLNSLLYSGVNHIDIAPLYGNAEQLLGTWLKPFRRKFIVSSKTLRRTFDAAWKELNLSLEQLNIDKFNIYQLHAINKESELNEVFSTNGAIKALIRGKESGLVNYIGITSHGMQSPTTLIHALKRFEFDVLMLPINPNLFSNPDYSFASKKLLSLAQENDVGVIGTKAIAKGPWQKTKSRYSPWYEPFTEMEKIAEGVTFVLSQPGITSIASAGDIRLLPKQINVANSFKLMNDNTQEEVIDNWRKLDPIFKD